MARSSVLPLLLVAALFVMPAFVPSAAPRSAPNAAAASAAAGMLPLLVVQPALAEDYMMPPSWPFLLIFVVLARAGLGATSAGMDLAAISANALDPDDPSIKGRSWEAVEKALKQRDAYVASLNGYDIDTTEPRGPSFEEPCNPLYSTFPWEEKVDGFDKPASCNYKNWRHQCLKYKIGTQCATLQMDSGDGENGLNPAMLDAFQDAIMDLQDRTDVRVVLLKSTGKFFSNGFDPKHLLAESTMSDEAIIAFQIQYAKVLYFLQRLQQLTVAVLQGTAMGAGIGLVCACDYVISVKGAFFTMSEAKLGAVPSAALPYITRRCTFIKNVYQLVLAGARINAEVAEEYGFVDKVVDEAKDLEVESQAVCDRMTLCAPGAVAATKEVVMNTVGVPPSSFMMNYVASIVADIRKGPESKAGMEAVQSKSRPKWADTAIAP